MLSLSEQAVRNRLRLSQKNKKSIPFYGTRGRKPKLNEEQRTYLASKQTLKKWSIFTLRERTVLFHRRFPESKISVSYLSKFYRSIGVKRKKLYIMKKRQHHKKEELLFHMTELQQRLWYLKEAGYKIIMVDEAVFTKSSIQNESWRPRNTQFKLEDYRADFPAYSVVAGISEEDGLEHYLIKQKSIKSEDFQKFLVAIRKRNRNKRCAVFLDNLSVHRTRVVKECAKETGIVLLYNLPYAPAFNGIEYFWNLVKQYFKKRFLNLLLERQPLRIIQLIKGCLHQVSKKQAQNCAIKGLKLIKVC